MRALDQESDVTLPLFFLETAQMLIRVSIGVGAMSKMLFIIFHYEI